FDQSDDSIIKLAIIAVAQFVVGAEMARAQSSGHSADIRANDGKTSARQRSRRYEPCVLRRAGDQDLHAEPREHSSALAARTMRWSLARCAANNGLSSAACRGEGTFI